VSSPIQHLFRLLGVTHDADDLVLTDQDPVLLVDVEGADVALRGATAALGQSASELIDEDGIGRDLTALLRTVLLGEGHIQSVVVGEREAEDGGERKFGGVVHVRIVPFFWRVSRGQKTFIQRNLRSAPHVRDAVEQCALRDVTARDGHDSRLVLTLELPAPVGSLQAERSVLPHREA